MGALDPAKILVILVVALVVLGPERLPRAAREIGAVWHELVRIREQVVGEVRGAIPEEFTNGQLIPKIPRPTPGAVSGFVAGLMSSRQSDAPNAVQIPVRTEDLEQGGSTNDGAAETAVPRAPVRERHDGEFTIAPDDPSMN